MAAGIFVRNIQRAVASHHGLPVEIMREARGFGSQSRQRSWPRQDAMLLAKRMTGKPWTEIGRLFNRDHSTVIAGVRSARRRCLADRERLRSFCEIRAAVLAEREAA